MKDPTNGAVAAQPGPSDRSFGWTFAGVFIVLAGISLWRGGAYVPLWALLAGITAAVTVIRPHWLAPLNRWWMKLAEVMHRFVNPILLGLIFFVAITPMALVMRLARRDSLRRDYEPKAETYWIIRDPPGPNPKSLKDQF
jgi:hypothetical protein